MSDFSANEIAGLVLKAARGGGMPTGLGEDLAVASAFLNLEQLTKCPCSSGAATVLPSALDAAVAGQGPQAITADHALIEAYIAALETQTDQTLIWQRTPHGAVIEGVSRAAPEPHAPLGRRSLSDDLLAHLKEMGAKMLVPETDASRQAGAGAGLTDND